jgi:SAM-dependent methyltransferase
MTDFVAANRALWTELTEIHQRPSSYYDVEAFKAGGLSLRSIERAEVGDVSGKTLLHLQCHFGLDTLSWARLGARVTGVDFCEPALVRARQLAAESGLDARFVCADLAECTAELGEFDIVFTSYGTTVWLPDLARWARLIARSLRPGGMFYIVEGHPFSKCLDNSDDPAVLRVAHPYLSDGPIRCDGGFDYAVGDAAIARPSYEWSHGLGDIVTALAGAGLRIEFLHEFPVCEGEYLSNMCQDGDGWWRLADGHLRIPHSYSIKATR